MDRDEIIKDLYHTIAANRAGNPRASDEALITALDYRVGLLNELVPEVDFIGIIEEMTEALGNNASALRRLWGDQLADKVVAHFSAVLELIKNLRENKDDAKTIEEVRQKYSDAAPFIARMAGVGYHVLISDGLGDFPIVADQAEMVERAPRTWAEQHEIEDWDREEREAEAEWLERVEAEEPAEKGESPEGGRGCW